jgi:hypothetical protein
MFEYVMSGVAHSRVTYESCWGNERTLNKVNEALKLYQGAFGHYHSFLYNAYTEKKIGSDFTKFYRDSVYLIHADSGGLQVVTRGEEITPELKREVYKHQAEFSDIAMSFDEIPLSVDGVSSITDIDNRTFDYEKFEPCAVKSAKNLEEQIDYFQSVGSEAKPLLIGHGNNVDDFCRWVDLHLTNIPEHKHKHIGGLSLAGTALGAGMAEIIERLFSFSMIEAPDNMKRNLHLLGVGSIARMAPCSTFVLSGLFEGVHISYDSTTHSAGVTRGTRTTEKGGVQQYGRNDAVLLQGFRADIERLFPAYLDGLSDELFREILTSSRKPLFAKYEKDPDIKYWYHLLYFVAVQTSVLHAVQIINQNATDEQYFKKYASRKGMEYLIDLLHIQTKEQFLKWQAQAGSKIASQRVLVKGAKASLSETVDLSHTDEVQKLVINRPAPNTVKPPKSSIEEFFL